MTPTSPEICLFAAFYRGFFFPPILLESVVICDSLRDCSDTVCMI